MIIGDTFSLYTDITDNRSTIIPHILSISESLGEYEARQNGLPYRKLLQHKGLKVELNERHLSIRGSFPKYISGSNIYPLTYEQCKEGIEKLGTDLKIPIMEATVSRIDIAMTLVMNHVVSNYLLLLINGKSCTNRKEYKSTVEFGSGNRQLCFYDKRKEQKGSILHPFIADKNLFRYEMRLLNNGSISRALGVEKATMQDVFDHFPKLVRRWANEYRSVLKQSEITTFSDEVFRSVKDFKNHLMREGMEAMGGYQAIQKLIQVANSNKVFQYPAQMSNLKTKLRQISQLSGRKVRLDYIKELDEKINDAELFALSESLPWDHYEIAINDGVSEKISAKPYN